MIPVRYSTIHHNHRIIIRDTSTKFVLRKRTFEVTEHISAPQLDMVYRRSVGQDLVCGTRLATKKVKHIYLGVCVCCVDQKHSNERTHIIYVSKMHMTTMRDDLHRDRISSTLLLRVLVQLYIYIEWALSSFLGCVTHSIWAQRSARHVQ